MFAALGLSSDFIKWASVAIAIVCAAMVIFATYRHFENNRTALVTEAKSNAAASVASQVNKASADFVTAQAAKMATEIEAKDKADASEQAAWDKTFSQIDALPLDATAPADPDEAEDKADPEALAPPLTVTPTPTKKKSHVAKPKTDPAARGRALDAQLDGMLERSSGAAD